MWGGCQLFTMPLSELVYRMAKGKVDSSQEKNPASSTDPSFIPENDFVELVWEDGLIQSSRNRKVQNCNSLPSQHTKIRDKDVGNGSDTKLGNFGIMESIVDETPMSVPSIEMSLNQDDNMVPWLNYPIEESLRHDFCSQFLPELSGVSVSELSSKHNFASLEKRIGRNQSIRDAHTVSAHNDLSLEHGSAVKICSSAVGEAAGPRTSDNQPYSSPSKQHQTSFPNFRSRVSASSCDGISNATKLVASRDSIQVSNMGSGFPSTKTQKQVPALSTTNSSVMNFSYFTRPAALVRANLQNVGGRAGSEASSIERPGSKDRGSIEGNTNIGEFTLIDSCSGLQIEKSSYCHPIMPSSKVSAKPDDAKPADKPVPAKVTEDQSQEDESKNETNFCQSLGESANRGLTGVEKTIETVVASSSICSVNSVERVSDEPIRDVKRKHRDTDSEGPSEDVEEELVGAKKTAAVRGTGSKRSRAAEVHNLSERRRRDRINEKMRALQELIPNCNKVDKASMLDEAIEYLKTLQLQVQIMSMGAGLYMPSMIPPGMPHLHPAHMAQFSPLGVGMGMGFGMGMPDMNGRSSGCSMIHMPSIHGAPFAGLPMSGPNALQGMGGSNLQMFGFSGQGLSMPYPRAPLMPVSGGPLLKTSMGPKACGVMGPMDNPDLAPVYSSKNSIQNISSHVMQHNGANSSLNQTSSQRAATSECFKQPSLVQNNGQVSKVTNNGALESVNGNDNVPTDGAGCD